MTLVVAAVWAATALLGAILLRRQAVEKGWTVGERRVAFRFWRTRWWGEECGPVLYYFTVAMCLLALAVLVGMASG